MDTLYTTTDILKESYMATFYGNTQVAFLAPDIHGIQFALSRLDGDHIGTLRVSFSVDFVGRNLFTRERKVLKDYSLLPIEQPKEDAKPYTHAEKIMMAIHILMDQVESDWLKECAEKIDI